MTQKLSKDVETRIVKLADHLIRIGRWYVAAVKAPNREKNQQAEKEFADALLDLGEWIESFPDPR